MVPAVDFFYLSFKQTVMLLTLTSAS
ncbi:hypothetical protein PUN4_10003 [Paraburkholderia unamae]|nr:hypothetical protein PUN4_10003 [Paraburkholderia unamae]